MADRWMDERDRQWRERDWRRNERLSRSGQERGDYDRGDYGGADYGDRSFEPRDPYARGQSPYPSDQYRQQGGPDYTRPESSRRYAGEISGQARGGHWQGYQNPYPNERSGYQARHGGDYSMNEGRSPNFQDERGRSPDRYDNEDERRRASGYGHEDYARQALHQSMTNYAGRYEAQRPDYARRQGPVSEAHWPDDTRRAEDDRGHSGGRNFLERATDKLSSWFGYDEDQRRASGGHRGRGPQGYKRSDERITEEVHERLTDDPWLDASHIQVAVSGGEVTLTGTVEDREAKHRAERIVEDLSGVHHVQNNLRVQPGNPLTGSGHGFGDSANAAQMRQAEAGASHEDSTAARLATTMGADPTLGQPQERTSTGRKTDS